MKADSSLPNAMERIRQAACRDKKLRFTTLWHHVYNINHLRRAYFSLKRNAAPGVDGETWQHYGVGLEENLQDLSDRLKRGAYRAKPVKRAYIPKSDGRQRPLGVTTLEDKIVQKATAEVLNAIYETDFLGFSYGFRPGRSPHDALNALYAGIMTRKVSWVLDADIRGYFNAICHQWLEKFIKHRIADKRVIRHIKKWLNAGVLEDGGRIYNEEGVVVTVLDSREFPGLHTQAERHVHRMRCCIEELNLVPGRYHINVVTQIAQQTVDSVQAALTFEVLPGNLRDHAVRDKTRGVFVLPHRWETEE